MEGIHQMRNDTYSIEIEQGSTFELMIKWMSDSRSAINIDNASARMHIRRTTNSSETVIALDSRQTSAISLYGSLGRIDVRIEAADNAVLPSGFYVYDLEIELSDGTVHKLLKGKCKVLGEVTR